MRKARILLIFGVWITVLPYLGFPYSWKDFLGTISGLGLVFLSYVFYRDYKSKEGKKKVKKTFENFRENNDFIENEDRDEIKNEADTVTNQELPKKEELSQEEKA